MKLEKYIEDFDRAKKLSFDWQVVTSEIETITPDDTPESEQFVELVNSAYFYAVDHLEKSGVTRQRIRLSCATISYIIHKKLELAGIKSTLTIGDYYFVDSYMYETTQKYLSDLMKDPSGLWHFHVWLTLENGTLIDATRMIYHEKDRFLNKETNGKPLVSHISRLSPALSYKPIILGEKYLKKVEALTMNRNSPCYCLSENRFKHCCGKV
ncbi:TPA: SEC-C domain-containing protein [Vibrio parahaemolyticus]|nr:SEC-C domain-containing protein [Vibrio parahaemolyticus]